MAASDSTPTKLCRKCGRELPATTEYFYPNEGGKYGLHSRCKACHSAQGQVYRQNNREKIRKKAQEYYVVNRSRIRACERTYAATHREEALERSRRHKRRHAQEIGERRREEYWADPEAARAKQRRYRQVNPEVYKAAQERFRERHPDRVRESGRRWRRANLIKDRVKSARRRALKRKAEGSHSAQDILNLLKRQKGRCYYCGKAVGDHYHVEHVVPLFRGGTNDMSNIVIACQFCNDSKGTKLPHEWPEGGRLL